MSQYADLCKRLRDVWGNLTGSLEGEAADAITQLERELQLTKDLGQRIDDKLIAAERERDAALKRVQELRTRCEALEAEVLKWKRECQSLETLVGISGEAIAAREVGK